MDVSVGRADVAVSEQASGDMQALAVHDRVRRVRMSQIVKPPIRHDPGRIACLDPEPPQVIRTQRSVSFMQSLMWPWGTGF
ncbi:MAG: hypothetical protein OXB95_03080 [Rhodobacteraceae bacterium]|nr:hypothetical protein [Paracoccaceae bacterium]